MHRNSAHGGNRVHFAFRNQHLLNFTLIIGSNRRTSSARWKIEFHITTRRARGLRDYPVWLWATRDLPVGICRRRSDREITAVLALKSRVIAGGSFSIGTSRSDRVVEIKTRGRGPRRAVGWPRTHQVCTTRDSRPRTTSEAGRRSALWFAAACYLLANH